VTPGTERFGWRAVKRTLSIALLLVAFDAHATQWFVGVGGAQLSYVPQSLTINVGDTVVFYNIGGYHNAVADDGSFRCAHGCDGDGKGGSGNATNSLWIASVAFTKSGTVGYFCEPHGAPGSGMFGTIQVLAPAAIEPAPSGSAKLDLLLAAALIALATFRLRRYAGTHSRRSNAAGSDSARTPPL
jgi:plastocyanin